MSDAPHGDTRFALCTGTARKRSPMSQHTNQAETSSVPTDFTESAAPGSSPQRRSGRSTSWAVVLIVICGMAIGTILALRRPVPRAEVAGFDPQPDARSSTVPSNGSEAAQIADPSVTVVRPNESSRRAVTAAVVAPSKKAKAATPKVPAAPEADGFGSALNALPITVTETSPVPAFDPSPTAIVETLPVARIAGCLERESGTLLLKDTEGADAPKSRSWKSGFLKKRSSSVEVVDDAAGSPELSSYIGQRVEATGTLVNRQMRVRSLQAIGGSCN